MVRRGGALHIALPPTGKPPNALTPHSRFYRTYPATPSIPAVTGLSGSGPAYVCMFIEALADGGVASGLPRAVAMGLAVQLVKGAATLVQETGTHPGALKDAVASPGGTTIAGILELEKGGMRGIVMSAVVAATKRGAEMREAEEKSRAMASAASAALARY